MSRSKLPLVVMVVVLLVVGVVGGGVVVVVQLLPPRQYPHLQCRNRCDDLFSAAKSP